MWGGSLGVARGVRPGRPAGSAVPGAGVSTPSDVQGTLMVAVARGGPHLSAPAGGGRPKRFARESVPGSCRSGSGPERRGCRAPVSGHRASAGTDTSLRPQPGSRLTLDDAETFPSVRRRLGLGAFGGAVPTAVEGPGLQLSKAQDAPSTPPREGAGPKAPSEGTSGEPRRAAGRPGGSGTPAQALQAARCGSLGGGHVVTGSLEFKCVRRPIFSKRNEEKRRAGYSLRLGEGEDEASDGPV